MLAVANVQAHTHWAVRRNGPHERIVHDGARRSIEFAQQGTLLDKTLKMLRCSQASTNGGAAEADMRERSPRVSQRKHGDVADKFAAFELEDFEVAAVGHERNNGGISDWQTSVDDKYHEMLTAVCNL
jgi:hypothetical protein